MKFKIHPYKIVHLLALLLCFACEKPIQWDLQYTDKQRLVVESIITDELKPQQVKLTRAIHKLNEAPVSVNSAKVEVWALRGDGSVEASYFFEESDSVGGVYISEPFAADHAHTYLLKINVQVDGKSAVFVDSARATMAYIDALEPLAFYPSDTLYRFFYAESDVPSMLQVDYNWDAQPDFCRFYGACEAREYYYTLRVYSANRLFAPEKQQIGFPSGTQITRCKYSLSEGHQEFLRHLLTETEWRGGLFDVEAANVPSNFSNGSLGFFGVCMVLGDTTFVP